MKSILLIIISLFYLSVYAQHNSKGALNTVYMTKTVYPIAYFYQAPTVSTVIFSTGTAVLTPYVCFLNSMKK